MLSTIQNMQNSFVGNGISTVFTTDFVVFRAEDIALYVDNTLVTTGFVVSDLGVIAGATITFDAPPDDLAAISVILDAAPTRDTDYQDNGDFLAETVNRDLDRLWQAMQQRKPLAYSGPFAGRPAVSTLTDSDQVFFTDFPNADGVGSWFRPITALDIFSPLAGQMFTAANFADVPTDGTATDQKVLETFYPEGLLRNPYKIKINTMFSKDSGVIAGTYRVRIGTAGDDTDAVVHTVAIAADTRSDSIQTDIMIGLGDETAIVCPTANGGVSESTTPWPSPVAIPNTNENGVYVSVWFEPAGATIITAKNATMLLFVL